MTVLLQRLMLVGGSLKESVDGDWLTSIDPADETPLERVPRGRAADVEASVDAAARAAEGWARTPVLERQELLLELADRAESRAGEILDLEVRDTGNTRNRMAGDVASATRLLRYYAGLGLELKGETVPATAYGIHASVREPYGVVGRILSFNHPFMFAASRLAAPLMAGNAVVLKPSEESPLSAMVLGEMCADLFPTGVVSILSGTGVEAGRPLVTDPRVKRLTFIGSEPTGRAIQRDAAEAGIKEVTLELGGKNPLIAFDDVEPEQIAQAAVAGMNFGHQGQSCGSTSRLLVHASIYDEVVSRVAELLRDLRLGDPGLSETDMGPLNSARHLARVEEHVAAAIEDGAELVTGGRRPPGEAFGRGFWFEPTLFTGVTPSMRLFGSEVFGPVLGVTVWSDTDELLELANGVEYGLTASIWSRDIDRALGMARRVQAGYVWVNCASSHFPGTSFGGTKSSGLGTEEGLDELFSFTETKTINVALPADF